MLNGGHHALFYFFSQTGKPLPDYSGLIQSLNLRVKVIWGQKDDILVWKHQK